MNRRATCPYCHEVFTLTTEQVLTLPRNNEGKLWHTHECSDKKGNVRMLMDVRR